LIVIDASTDIAGNSGSRERYLINSDNNIIVWINQCDFERRPCARNPRDLSMVTGGRIVLPE
jgi:hypothetical protein